MAAVERSASKHITNYATISDSNDDVFSSDASVCDPDYINDSGNNSDTLGKLIENRVGHINNIVKAVETSSVSPTDKRVCHNSHPRKYTQDTVDHVHKHIDQFPKYRKPLQSEKEFRQNVYVCGIFRREDKYGRIFTEDSNVSFKTSKSDTCPTCDELSIEVTASDGQHCRQNEHESHLHQRRAEAGQTNIQHQTTRAKSDPDYHIVSCLKKHLEVNDIRRETSIAIPDNCCGQNENWNAIGFWLCVVSAERFKCVEHHFPLPGHSMLPTYCHRFREINSCRRRCVVEMAKLYGGEEIVPRKKNPPTDGDICPDTNIRVNPAAEIKSD
ncbi:hypothetical protein PR048_003460 [Dryococelus australis]|uniref:Uncharacterized protein n=1 Tax=Dryococelus australis TaxID=614101 RepID=A0ABQ9IN14_9NEOP|nr:hypothetical protein PR048_003460 [Dryococelus australis]